MIGQSVPAPRYKAPVQASDPYYAAEQVYRTSSNAKKPNYESPAVSDYDPDEDETGFGETGTRADRPFQPSMRRYDNRYTSKGVPQLHTENLSKVRAPVSAQYVESGGRRYASDPLSAVSPLSPTAQRRESRRRSSVQDKSPLQRLEITLDEKSKEEKRARVLEAEMAAQERLDKGRGTAVRPNGAIAAQRDPVVDQRPDPSRAPKPAAVETGGIKRSHAVREPPSWPNGHRYSASNDPSSRLPSRVVNDPTLVKPSHPSVQNSVPFRYNGGYRSTSDPYPSDSTTMQQTLKTGQSAPYQRRDPKFVPDATLAGPVAAATVATAGAAAGLSQHPPDSNVPASGVGRSGSRKLQKGPPPEHRFSGRWYSGNIPAAQEQAPQDRVSHNSGEQTAPTTSQQGQMYAQNAQNRTNYGPPYSVPSPPTAGVPPRKAVGINEHAPAVIPVPHQNDKATHRLSNLIHIGHRDDTRRYQVGPQPSQWDKIQTARLTDEDLDLTPAPVVRDTEEQATAWWEKSNSRRRRSSAPAVPPQPAVTYDGYFDQASGQTSFNPLLYLKCGPLLRFRGIYKQGRPGSDGVVREIWRGSLMIVTGDSRSDYSRGAPTLRLFKQPVNLLPPPPAQIDGTNGGQLAPEYVDPIAGQIKMSRIGKTLHVKPVELLDEHKDLSAIENDNGLFEERPTGSTSGNTYANQAPGARPNVTGALPIAEDGEKLGKVRELPGIRLWAERGVTFWKWNIEIPLGSTQQRIAYRINRGPIVGFWIPAQGEAMNMMFHSCNGFSLSVHPDDFSGPDPLWRDVLNTHQTRPFHVMIGGGDQVYMDACTVLTTHFREWTAHKNPHYKHNAPFTPEMQDELEDFYLARYSTWFSQGLFGMATSQIPMVNIWDDHDIIDGYGSYPHYTMSSPVFTGIGAVAFKYYMLFQHQSVPMETEAQEPSWLLGYDPGPYINQLSRSVFMSFGNGIQFLGLDCRTERSRDEILSRHTWDKVIDRCRAEIHVGETSHLIVLLGVPIAYPRLNFLENVLTSRAMDPIKAVGRTGILGGFVNKFDGGVEILDDLDDHWTAKHHKKERNWFIQELQELAAEKSVRVTILGGDVHLAAVGRFYSSKKLGIPKDRDHRYMPNIISSAIVNTPPGEMLADILNRRNKVHHLDDDTDEDMIDMFPHDVNGKVRHNTHLLPHRNWCSIRQYHPGTTPPPTPPMSEDDYVPQSGATNPDNASYESVDRTSGIRRTLSIGRRSLETPRAILRRLSGQAKTPPISYYNAMGARQEEQRRASSDDAILNRPNGSSSSGFAPGQTGGRSASDSSLNRPSLYHRRPSGLSAKDERRLADDDRGGHIDLTNGLDIRLNVENVRGDPAGTTTEYRLLVPALDYRGQRDENTARRKGRMRSLLESLTDRNARQGSNTAQPPTVEPPGADSSPGGPPSTAAAPALLNGQNARLARLQAQDDPSSALGLPPGAQARANAVDALPPSPIYGGAPAAAAPSGRAPAPLPTPRDDSGYGAAGSLAEPAATVGAGTHAAPGRAGDGGRPLRRRWRGNPYDEDAVLPSAGVVPAAAQGAPPARNQSRWSDEFEDAEELPVDPPSHPRWSSPPREHVDERRAGVLGRVRDRMSGWRAWRI